MSSTKLILIPGRSLKQGSGMNLGKDTAEYRKEVSTLEMNREDMVRLGAQDGDALKIRTSGGEATVQCCTADLPEGMAFIAYGPISSELMDQDTQGSGMPDSKGFEVEVERVG